MAVGLSYDKVTPLTLSCQVLIGTPFGICQLDDLSASVHPIPGLPDPPPTKAVTATGSAGKKSEGVAPSTAVAAAAAAEPQPSETHVLHLATSPDGGFVAAYSNDARVHVFSSGEIPSLVSALYISMF